MKRTLTILLLYAVGIYVAFAVLDGMRDPQSRKKMLTAWFFILLGFIIGAAFMYKHLTCEGCQQRYKNLKRNLALKFIE